MGTIIGLLNLLGVFVSWFVYYQRAGLAEIKSKEGIDWREFLIPNLPWFAMMLAKCVVWEVVLIVWLAQGRPRSRWAAITHVEGRPARMIRRVNA